MVLIQIWKTLARIPEGSYILISALCRLWCQSKIMHDSPRIIINKPNVNDKMSQDRRVCSKYMLIILTVWDLIQENEKCGRNT